MIDVYSWPTPNGHKVHIMLEECGAAVQGDPDQHRQGDQFGADFLRFSPNNKIPAIIEPGRARRGSRSRCSSRQRFLLYLAEKTGKFVPPASDLRGRVVVWEWLMFQMGSVGPMLGQAHHFRNYAPEKLPYAIDRYTNEAGRIYRVIDKRLASSPYLAGDELTIADFATFPWLRSHENQGQKLEDTPHLKKWYDEIAARPAVERGVQVLSSIVARADVRRGEGGHVRQGPVRRAVSPQSGSNGGAGEASRTRALRWGLWGCTTILIALVALMVVVASIAYLDYSEPDSAFPGRLAEAAGAAGEGGTVDLAVVIEGDWDSAHLFARDTDAAAITACLGFAWDKAELVADHLARDAPGAFAVVTDGEVIDYGWHLGGVSFADWPCGLTPANAAFTVTREGDSILLRHRPSGGDE